MDGVMVALAEVPSVPRKRGAEARIKQLIKRHKQEVNSLTKEAEYLQRVASMLIPLVPKQTVASILRDAKGELENVRIR